MNRISVWMLVGVATLATGYFAVAQEHSGHQDKEREAATTRPAGDHHAAKYACPMGCVSSEKPGKCPKCGMDMVKQKPATTKPAHQHQH